MIDGSTLRNILKTIYGIDDSHLIALSESMFVPTTDRADKTGDWIGYRILDKQRITQAYADGIYFVAPLKVRFRIAYVGPHAEEFADQTIIWENRNDVQKAFDLYGAQVFYNTREEYSYPIKNTGFNDSPCWIVDMTAQTTYEIDTNWKPWIPR